MKKLYPVIHFISLQTAETNIKICLDNGCNGVFLINMDCDSKLLNPSLELARKLGGDDFFVGVNRLDTNIKDIQDDISSNKIINGLWEDNPGLYDNEKEPTVSLINEALNKRWEYDLSFNFFGSVAFKTHIKKSDPKIVGHKAIDMGWVPTTSGSATGKAADIEKIKIMKKSIGTFSLAIASGITPENVNKYLPYVDYFLVATGISKDFYNFDENKVKELSTKIKEHGKL